MAWSFLIKLKSFWSFSNKSVSSFSDNKSDRRLYVDMFFRKTEMYAIFTPSSLLQLGDYGDINKMGEFIRCGNIFDEFPIDSGPLGHGSEEFSGNPHFFVSNKKNTATFLNATLPSLMECQPKLGWQINKDRHAVLVMINANRYEIANEGKLHRLIQDQPKLADKAIVTKVYQCSAYAQLLTESGQTGEFHVGFKSNPAHYNAAETDPRRVAIEKDWHTFPSTANWRTGSGDPSKRPYSPLVTLRQIRPKAPTLGYREQIPSKIADDNNMDNFIPPWAELDEMGEEIE